MSEFVSNFLGVDAFVFHAWETVVNPEERANLHLVVRCEKLFDSVWCNLYNFARTNEAGCVVVEVQVAVAFGGNGVARAFATDDERSASVLVTCSDNSIGGENQHAAASLDVAVNILYAVGKVLALGD